MINMIHAPALKLATACRNLVQYCLKRRGVTRPDVPCQNSKREAEAFVLRPEVRRKDTMLRILGQNDLWQKGLQRDRVTY